ncbi:hypothetical protein CAMRE0001_1044 [Campylobacter rectus RM3267]|uniref:Uncharacterized protein n=1 Tax=Campylobacter rectus RM3267 TaxID=553218 RepID=B9D2U4_CAMRE|nr:hypothetical protein [Campylobacter rectus]EEF13692.1 hypothetical protein CAMRE0001_1044 [Campylobacter rectus RM3267]UEB47186.1 hypothetical protein LK437_09265 [Campylobacter rectus]
MRFGGARLGSVKFEPINLASGSGLNLIVKFKSILSVRGCETAPFTALTQI